MTITHVSFNYDCDRETRELGEDCAELRKIERAWKLLAGRTEQAARRVHSARATATVMMVEQGLAELRHDASFGATLSLAADAYSEAMVRPVEIKSARAA